MSLRSASVLLMLVLAACAHRAPPPAPASAPAAQGAPAIAQPDAAASGDPYLWLENIDSDSSMAWVRAHNELTHDVLARSALFDSLYTEALAALNAQSRIPVVTVRGDWLYNFWRDESHPRGVYRRTTRESLRGGQPAWQTVLDIDSLAAAEAAPWVFHGMSCLPPEHRHCLVYLSPGGGDADEMREWDMATLSFVEDGFRLPVAKTNVAWRDENALYVGTDFGPGSMTTSGYPRIVKLWRRGTPLAAATTLFEGDSTSVSVFGSRLRTDSGYIDLIGEGTTFWETEYHGVFGDELFLRYGLPLTVELRGAWRCRLVVALTEDWDAILDDYGAGSVVLVPPYLVWEVPVGPATADGRSAATRVDARPASDAPGGEEAPCAPPPSTVPYDSLPQIEALFEPRDGEVLSSVDVTPQGILLTVLDDVRGRVWRYEPAVGGGWTRRAVAFPDNGTIAVTSVDDESGDFFATYESFVTPPTLYHVDGETLEPTIVAQQAPTFDGTRFDVTQHWATSADGTRVPYFMIAPRGIALDGTNPTHVFAYGGFRNALTPSYSGSYEAHQGAYGRLWLERGGVYVVANIRGGGEFGPAWHAAALRENRPRAFEDFEAVAEDLIRRGVTSPEHLGIEGRSNGGLLVLATMARRPDLYGAVVAGVPLSDMQRYHRLLAGASWMAEYGDPDVPADWEFMRRYSPYQNIEAGVDYPPVLFYGSTRDDRVHPGHARKTAALLEQYDNDVLFYENIEGGHGGSVTNEQLAYRIALSFAHLWRELGGRAERLVP